jgi:hypothetical protein
MEPLDCSAIVYRAMARKNWVDVTTQSVLPAAFVRRLAPADEDGLSVDIESALSCSLALKKCHGVAGLHVGRVRTLGLEVVVDEAPHANITGVPRSTDDQAQSERLASLLARQARLVPPEAYQGG